MTDHGEIYRRLSAMYGWTPREIAQLTHDQQMMYLGGHGGRTQTCATVGEARALVAGLKGQN